MTANLNLRISVRVVPNASRSEVVGWMGSALKIKVQAPPEGGRANKEVVETLARHLGLGKKDIVIEAGETSRDKRLCLNGITEQELRAKTGGE